MQTKSIALLVFGLSLLPASSLFAQKFDNAVYSNVLVTAGTTTRTAVSPDNFAKAKAYKIHSGYPGSFSLDIRGHGLQLVDWHPPTQKTKGASAFGAIGFHGQSSGSQPAEGYNGSITNSVSLSLNGAQTGMMQYCFYTKTTVHWSEPGGTGFQRLEGRGGAWGVLWETGYNGTQYKLITPHGLTGLILWSPNIDQLITVDVPIEAHTVSVSLTSQNQSKVHYVHSMTAFSTDYPYSQSGGSIVVKPSFWPANEVWPVVTGYQNPNMDLLYPRCGSGPHPAPVTLDEVTTYNWPANP
jgi:hypothetical protein